MPQVAWASSNPKDCDQPPLPKDCDYKRLIALLKRYEYEIVRQRGSHIRLHSDRYSHSIPWSLASSLLGHASGTVPAHTPLKIGTLNSIITDVAARVGEKKKNLVEQL